MCQGMSEPGVISSILALLRSSEPSSQIEGAGCVSRVRCSYAMMDTDAYQLGRDAIVSAGALPFLTAMLSSSEPSVYWAALDALYALLLGSNKTQTIDAVMSTGVLMPLVILLKSPENDMQIAASKVIGCLASDPQSMQEFVAAGTLQVVVPWLRGPDRFMQLMAAEMMLQIAKDENSFDAIITAGALPCLHLLSASPIEDPVLETKEDEWIIARTLVCVLATSKEQGSSGAELAGAWPSLLASLKSPSPRLQHDAARVVHHLACHSQQCKEAIIMSGALTSLEPLLTSRHIGLEEQALKVIMQLACNSRQNVNALISAGVLPPLVALLKSSWTRLLAAQAIKVLAVDESSIKAVVSAGALPPLLAMLKEPRGRLQSVPLMLLEAIQVLASDKSSIDTVVLAGAIEPLTALLNTRDPYPAEAAVRILCRMAASTQRHKDAVISAGALPLLKHMLQHPRCVQSWGVFNPDLSEAAADAIQTLERPCV